MTEPDQPLSYYRYQPASGWQQLDGRVIVETSVSLTVNGEVWLVFNCSPTQLEALAAGFLFNEGILQTRDEIVSVYPCHQNTNVDVWLRHIVDKPTEWTRTSGCTGGVTAQKNPTLRQPVSPAPPAGMIFTPQLVLENMRELLHTQELYRATGGVHASALSDGKRFIAHAEDIGRHNTIDKISGQVLLDRLDARGTLLLTTGRISAEMLQKAAALQVGVVASRTSPTSESITLADQAGISLVGYARQNQVNVYTHPELLGFR
jgi:FdhD protein